jgi:hypothetical protein
MSKKVHEFAELYKIKLFNSSPYYAHANGQAESSNRTLIDLIERKTTDHPRHWHRVLAEALWAHRISKHHATKLSPFELVYGQEAVLHVEISLNAIIFARQNDLRGILPSAVSFSYFASNCQMSSYPAIDTDDVVLSLQSSFSQFVSDPPRRVEDVPLQIWM